MNKFILLFILIFSFYCKPEKLKISKVNHCENFNSHGECKEPSGVLRSYKVKIPENKKIRSWEELGNYLYFHSRQTPGLILEFNRDFTLTELKDLNESLKIYYDFGGSRGKIEGLEIGSNWIGIFQYLGSMLKQKVKEEGKELNYPKLEKIFPIKIKYYYSSNLFQSQTEFQTDLTLE